MEYIELVNVYESLEKTSKRLEKTYYISNFLKKALEKIRYDKKEMKIVALLLQGRVYAVWEQKKIGVASKLIVKAISTATGLSLNKVEEKWKKTGDLGITAEETISKKKQQTLFSKDLTIKKVYDNIKKLPMIEGQGSVDYKIKAIAELLTSAKPIEAKYIVRTVLEDLRIGVGNGVIRDSIVWAFFDKELGIEYDNNEKKIILSDENRKKYNEYSEKIQEAYDITSDFGEVILKLAEKGISGLSDIKIRPGKPVKVMLYQKAKNIKDAFENVGRPAAIEYKYDGFRMQIHKDNDKIMLFTRRLENVTDQFPDVVEAVKKNVNAKSFILDSEAVGYNKKTDQYLPFQSISQRIKRKYDIREMAKRFPVEVNVFDVLFYNGKPTIKMPFHERRAIISRIIEQKPRKIVTSRIMITDKEDEANRFYHESLDNGNEGIMVKNLNAIYKPGSRVGFGMKVKPVMETLDLVITGAEWGEGKRARWLTSFTLACIDDDGRFLEVGKVGTGIKELKGEGITFEELTEMLKPLAIREKGKYIEVKPNIVLEVQYEEIQKSKTYSSGYALRFPRVIRLREDRSIEDIDNIETIKRLFLGQEKRKQG